MLSLLTYDHKHSHSRSADRRTVNPSLKFSYDANQNEEVISNDIEDNYNYGFPLDYYDYDVAPFATKVTRKLGKNIIRLAFGPFFDFSKQYLISKRNHFHFEKEMHQILT